MSNSSVTNSGPQDFLSFMGLDFRKYTIAFLTSKELIRTSAVCKAWHHYIMTNGNELWQERFSRVEICIKWMGINNQILLGEKNRSFYERWKDLMKDLLLKSNNDDSLFDNSLPPPHLGRAGHQRGFPYRRRLLYSDNTRRGKIAELQGAFVRALLLYSGGMIDRSFIGRHITYSKDNGFVLDRLGGLALVFLFNEGSAAAFFSLDLDDRSRVDGIQKLASYFLSQHKCEEALQWIETHLISIYHRSLLGKEILISFSEKAIQQVKTDLIKRLFSHMWPNCEENNLGYTPIVKTSVLTAIKALGLKGHGNIINPIAAELSLKNSVFKFPQ